MKEKIISFSFVLLLFFFLIGGIVLKDKEFSIYERRKLTTQNELKKAPFSNMEKYLSDQIPFRNTFLNFYSVVDRVLLRNKENNNIYIKNNFLIEKNYPLKEKNVEEFSQKINSMIKKDIQSSHIFYAIIPDKSYFLEEKGYQKLDFSKMINQLKKDIKIPYIDLFSIFNLNDYYQTDIHLKQEAYQKVVKELGKYYDYSLMDLKWYEKKYDNFYGASYAKGAFFSKPEELIYYINEWTEKAKVWHLEFQNQQVYDEEKLGSMDSYSVFLSGPSSLIEITNEEADSERELLLFRDSFGSSLAPFLLPYYKKITLIDLRYITLEKVEQYVKFENKDILFLYSTLLVNESNLLKVKIKNVY